MYELSELVGGSGEIESSPDDYAASRDGKEEWLWMRNPCGGLLESRQSP
jgi:hypothetical protein